MSTSKPYKDFTYETLNELKATTILPTSGLPVVALANDLVIIVRPYATWPTLFCPSRGWHLVSAHPGGPTYYDGYQDDFALLNEWTQPYQLSQHKGVWTVVHKGERRSAVPMVPYLDCPRIDRTMLSRYQRLAQSIERYVEALNLDCLDLALCRSCERRQIQHLLGHIERGDISPLLVDDLIGDGNDGETKARLRDGLIDLLTTYVVTGGQLVPAVTHRADRARDLGWRHRNA